MAKGGTKCWRDKTDEISFFAGRYIEEDFPLLQNVKLLYTFVDPARVDTDGMLVLGMAKKLPNSARDVFGCDFVIELAHEYWTQMTDAEKARVVWHELRHCQATLDQNGEPAEDSQGRIKIYVAKHEVVLKTFRDELEKFGLSKDQVEMTRMLSKLAKKQLSA